MGIFDSPFDPERGSGGVPISPKFPQNVSTFVNNWQNIQSQAGGIDPSVIDSIQSYDANRVVTGSSPLSKQAASLAILAAQNQKAQTLPPAEERGVLSTLGNIPSDAWEMVSGIPSLIGHLGSQIIHPLDTWDQMTNADNPKNAVAKQRMIDRGFNPEGGNDFTDPKYWADVLQRASETPLLELVPGIRTLSAVLPGGVEAGAMADHPLMTALDVLPFASKAARGTSVVEQAAADLGPGVQLKHPLTTLATRTINDSGDLVPNRFATWMDQKPGGSAAGQFLRQAFGKDARGLNLVKEDLEASQHMALTQPRESMIPSQVKAMPQYRELRDMHAILFDEAKKYNVAPERIPELTTLATTGDRTAILDLPANEADLVQKWYDISDSLGKTDVAQGQLIADPATTEIHTARTGGLIVRREQQIASKKQAFLDEHHDWLAAHQADVGADYRVAGTLAAIEQGDFVTAKKLISDMSRSKGNPGSAKAPTMASAGDSVRWMKQFESTVGVREDAVNVAKEQLANAKTPQEVAAATVNLNEKVAAHEKAIGRFKTRYDRRVRRWMAETPNMDPRLLKMWSDMEPGTPVHAALAAKEAADTEFYLSNDLPDPNPVKFSDIQPLGERFSRANMNELFNDRTSTSPLSPNAGQSDVMSANKLGKMNRQLAEINSFQKTLDKTREYAAPARFHELINQGVRHELVSRATPETAQAVLQAVNEKRYLDALVPDGVVSSAPDFNLGEWQRKELAKITNEQQATWMRLKDEGYDPVFLHRVSSDIKPNNLVPRSMGIRTPGHLKERQVLDVTPYHNDLNIGLTHQAMESMNRQVAEMFYKHVEDTHGISLEQVHERVDAMARRAAGDDPSRFLAERQALMQKHFMELDGEAMFGVKRATVTPKSTPPVYVPKHIGETLRSMNTAQASKLVSAIDPVTGMFRIATTALSPRSQLNNLTGNLLMTLVSHPSALLELPRAYRMMRGGMDLAEALRGKGASLDELNNVLDSEATASFLSELGSTRRDTAEIQFMAGNKVHKLLRQYNSPLADGFMRRAVDTAETAGKGVRYVADKSMTLNGWLDDLNKSMLFLSETKGALKRGAGGGAAAEAGVALSRRVAMQWKMLTPFERSAIRPLIPFYAFQRHMISFAMNYPFDHPIRTSILANIVATENEDQASGYPELFNNAFFFNATGKALKGEQKQNALNVGGMNPFVGVDSTFGLLGFLSGDSATAGEALAGANPMIKTLMQTVGFDARAGTADLYPDLQYDPVRGTMVYKSANNPITNLVTNLIPQSTIIANLVGHAADYEQMLVKNPAAAKRQLLSGTGLPILWRQYDVPAEYGKAELVRNQAQQDALNAGMKSGDWDKAALWPGNRQKIDSLKAMQEQNPAALQKYTLAPTADAAAALSEQLKALAGR